MMSQVRQLVLCLFALCNIMNNSDHPGCPAIFIENDFSTGMQNTLGLVRSDNSMVDIEGLMLIKGSIHSVLDERSVVRMNPFQQ